MGIAQSLEPPPEIAKRWCISGHCPTPADGFAELGKMRELVAASSNTTAHWQIGSTAANVGPFLA